MRLASSRQGHYLLNGQINGQGVTFLLDTGATQVAVPEALAARLALERGAPITLSTANGRATGWRTRLDQLQLGDIRLSGVAALIAPGMDGDEVLTRHERPETTRIHPARRHPWCCAKTLLREVRMSESSI